MKHFLQTEKNRTYYSKILLLSLVFLFSFFLKNAHAYTITSQLIKDQENSTTTIANVTQYLGTNYNQQINSVTSKFKYHFNSITTSTQARIYAFINEFTTLTYPSATLVASSTPINISTSTATEYTFTFQTNYTLQSNKWYTLNFSAIDGLGCNISPDCTWISFFGSNVTSSFPNETGFTVNNSNYPNIKQLYFSLIGSIGSTTASLTFPTNATTTNDFGNWVVQAGGSFSQIGIRYKLTSDTSYRYVDLISPNATINNEYLQIHKSQALWIPPMTSTTSWTAQLYWLDENNVETDANPITFTIDVTSIPSANFLTYLANVNKGMLDLVYHQSTSTDEACNLFALKGCFVNAITSIIKWTFVPQGGIDNNINNTKKQFEGLFPFSIFASVQNSASTTLHSATGTTNLNFPMQGLGPDIPIFYPHMISSTLNKSVEDTWFNTWTMLIWVGAGIASIKIIS